MPPPTPRTPRAPSTPSSMPSTPSSMPRTPGGSSSARRANSSKELSSIAPSSRWKLEQACGICGEHFSLVRGRHHCRYCGMSVCGKHSRGRAVVPTSMSSDKQRVCDLCYPKCQYGIAMQRNRGYTTIGAAPPTNFDDRSAYASANPRLEGHHHRQQQQQQQRQHAQGQGAQSAGSDPFASHSDDERERKREYERRRAVQRTPEGRMRSQTTLASAPSPMSMPMPMPQPRQQQQQQQQRQRQPPPSPQLHPQPHRQSPPPSHSQSPPDRARKPGGWQITSTDHAEHYRYPEGREPSRGASARTNQSRGTRRRGLSEPPDYIKQQQPPPPPPPQQHHHAVPSRAQAAPSSRHDGADPRSRSRSPTRHAPRSPRALTHHHAPGSPRRRRTGDKRHELASPQGQDTASGRWKMGPSPMPLPERRPGDKRFELETGYCRDPVERQKQQQKFQQQLQLHDLDDASASPPRRVPTDRARAKSSAPAPLINRQPNPKLISIHKPEPRPQKEELRPHRKKSATKSSSSSSREHTAEPVEKNFDSSFSSVYRDTTQDAIAMQYLSSFVKTEDKVVHPLLSGRGEDSSKALPSSSDQTKAANASSYHRKTSSSTARTVSVGASEEMEAMQRPSADGWRISDVNGGLVDFEAMPWDGGTSKRVTDEGPVSETLDPVDENGSDEQDEAPRPSPDGWRISDVNGGLVDFEAMPWDGGSSKRVADEEPVAAARPPRPPPTPALSRTVAPKAKSGAVTPAKAARRAKSSALPAWPPPAPSPTKAEPPAAKPSTVSSPPEAVSPPKPVPVVEEEALPPPLPVVVPSPAPADMAATPRISEEGRRLRHQVMELERQIRTHQGELPALLENCDRVEHVVTKLRREVCESKEKVVRYQRARATVTRAIRYATTCVAQKEYQAAVLGLLRAAAIERTNAHVWLLLAECRLHLRQLDEAEKACRTCLELKPSAVGHSMMGRILHKQGHRDAAIACYLTALGRS